MNNNLENGSGIMKISGGSQKEKMATAILACFFFILANRAWSHEYSVLKVMEQDVTYAE